ncbi:MAG: MMPL family transporter [Phycisphaerales bacterium]|nr:MMPL family transporter [Phycisphaerales bacterium]
MIEAAYLYAIRRPWPVMVIAGLVTLIAAPGVARLRLRTDGHALVPADAPAVRYDATIRDQHGIEDPFVVMILTDHADGVFNPATLALVDGLTREFGQLPGVEASNLFSLSTEPTYRVRTGTLDFKSFLEELPASRIECLRIREDLRRIRLYNGTLVSADLHATTILVGAPPGVDRVGMYARMRGIVDERNDTGDRIDIIGAPAAESLLGTHILQDLGVPESLLGAAVRRTAHGDPPGWPRSLYELRMMLGRRIGLVPIAMGIMALVFLIAFRSAAATALPFIEVGGTLVFVFGLMGWFDVPIYLTIAVVPIILTASGVADEIHVFHHYVHLLRERGLDDHLSTLRDTMKEMSGPVLKTSVTTTIGFLSFAMSPLAPVRAFGIFTGVGSLYCMAFSLIVIPAALAVIHPRRIVSARRSNSKSAGGRMFVRLADLLIRGRHVVVAGFVAIVAISIVQARKVIVQDSWVGGFDRQSAFYRATQTFDEQFLGSHILLATVQGTGRHHVMTLPAASVEHHRLLLAPGMAADPESLVNSRLTVRVANRKQEPGRPTNSPSDQWDTWIERIEPVGDRIAVYWPRQAGSPVLGLRPSPDETMSCEIRWEPFMDPATLRIVEGFEQHLDQRPHPSIGGAHGPAEFLKTSNFMVDPTQESNRSIPDSPKRIEWLWGQYERIRGTQRLHQVVSSDFSRAIVTVFLKNANFVDTARVMDDIRAYEREHLAPHGLHVDFAGDVAVSQTLIGAIVKTQVQSLSWSLVGILVVTAILGRSLALGLFAIIPCGVAVLLNFAFMGWTGIPLGVATSMFAGMTLGIGVDYAIHLCERCRWLMARGHDRRSAIRDALTAAGPAIVVDALGVALGFSVMVLSQVPANARLGALVVLSIVNCLAATLLLLPACLAFGKPGARGGR